MFLVKNVKIKLKKILRSILNKMESKSVNFTCPATQTTCPQTTQTDNRPQDSRPTDSCPCNPCECDPCACESEQESEQGEELNVRNLFVSLAESHRLLAESHQRLVEMLSDFVEEQREEEEEGDEEEGDEDDTEEDD